MPRKLVAVGWLVAIAIAGASAAEQSPSGTAPSSNLQRLQGTWEGVQVGSTGKITITITGDSLHFHRDAEFWFETTITLPAGKDPMQLHATIRDCPPSQADSIGDLVKAIFKIEDGTFTLATMDDSDVEASKSFEAAGTRYELRRQPLQESEIIPSNAR